jgi:hypothetical protein
MIIKFFYLIVFTCTWLQFGKRLGILEVNEVRYMSILQKDLILKESASLEQEHPEYFDALNKLVLEMVYRSMTKTPLMPNLPFHDTIKIVLDMLEHEIVSPNRLPSESVYQTSELATFFGVSQTAINNWIDEGRFGQWVDEQWTPYKRIKKGSHAHIRESWLWRSSTGETMSVSEVVRAYDSQFPSLKSDYTIEEHIQSVKDKITRYEQRYKSYVDLAQKTNRTSREDRDLDIWRLLISELGEIK